jgi:hypothetical protein
MLAAHHNRRPYLNAGAVGKGISDEDGRRAYSRFTEPALFAAFALFLEENACRIAAVSALAQVR